MKSRALRLAPIIRKDMALKLREARELVPFGVPDRRNKLVIEAMKACGVSAGDHASSHRRALFFAPHRAAKEKAKAQYWSFVRSKLVYLAEYQYAPVSGMPGDIERLCLLMGIEMPPELQAVTSM